jgi:hypothetical protein
MALSNFTSDIIESAFKEIRKRRIKMKVKELSLHNLRASCWDTIERALQEISTLDLEEDALAYYTALQRSAKTLDTRVLGFEEAGRITRLLLPVCGKPSSYRTTKLSATKVTLVTWPRLSLKKSIEVSNFLAKHKVEFAMSSKGVLEIYFPEDAPPSCFYTSGLPYIWRQKQAQKIRARKINEVARKIDRGAK